MSGRLLLFRRPDGNPDDLSDEALVAACAAGDRAALGVLFDRHGADVHRFLVRLRGIDDGVVDDLVQDVFLKAHEGAARFRSGAAVRTWLLGIAANVGKMHVRSEVRAGERGVAFHARTLAPAPRPDAEAERRELLGRMATALASLPHDQRVAFLLCDVEETRGVDAAAALGVRRGTLYRRLHEARKALRAAVLGDDP